MDEETVRYAAIIRAKQDRLNILELQAARYGIDAPPQIEMERGSLREELGMMETALQSPARSSAGDELGPAGRFVVYYQQNQDIKRSIAALAVRSEEWRMNQRNWLLLMGFCVVLILIAVVALVTYLITKGQL